MEILVKIFDFLMIRHLIMFKGGFCYAKWHGQPGYWRIRFDDWNGWEAPHIHASQGDRELQVYCQTLQIKNQEGRFSSAEIEEIKCIASTYANNHCLSVDDRMFEVDNSLDKVLLLKKLFSLVGEPKRVQ